jgi:hypothetical protein
LGGDSEREKRKGGEGDEKGKRKDNKKLLYKKVKTNRKGAKIKETRFR